MKKMLILLAIVLGLLAGGCSLGPPMTVQQEQNIYKVVADRGLKKGMTMDEVRELMGEPQQIINPLLRPNTSFWTYSSHSMVVELTPVGSFSRKIQLTFEYGKLVEAVRYTFPGYRNLLEE